METMFVDAFFYFLPHFLFSLSLPIHACKLEVSLQVSVHSHIATYAHITHTHRHILMYH